MCIFISLVDKIHATTAIASIANQHDRRSLNNQRSVFMHRKIWSAESSRAPPLWRHDRPSKQGRQPSKEGVFFDLSREICHVYGKIIDIKRQRKIVSKYDGMCEATFLVDKEKCVTSKWRQLGDFDRFGGDFERILWWIHLGAAFLVRPCTEQQIPPVLSQ